MKTEVIYVMVLWSDWANYYEAVFEDRKKAADYIRWVRKLAPQHLTKLTVLHC